jgi:hypothetical protein
MPSFRRAAGLPCRAERAAARRTVDGNAGRQTCLAGEQFTFRRQHSVLVANPWRIPSPSLTDLVQDDFIDEA